MSITARNTAVPFAVHNTAATAAECARAAAQYAAIVEAPAGFPCSFALNGAPQTGFAGFELAGHVTGQTGDRLTDTLTFRHSSGLTCRVECAAYPAYAAFEWTVYIKNEGAGNSPRISQLCGADILLPGRHAALQGILGDARNEGLGNGNGVVCPTYGMNNQPYRVPLAMDRPYEMHPDGGYSSNHEFPYFTLQTDAGAAMIAVGWPGQWKVTFNAGPAGVRYTAGQQFFDAYLAPGEEIRTPLTCILLADGDDEDRQTNLWRRFMLDCNMPRQGGVISQPTVGGQSYAVTPLMCVTNEAQQIEFIRAFREKGIRLDCWWMDAGWYTIDVEGAYPTDIDDFVFIGTWQVREKDFPTGLRAISDAMAATGGKTLLWFEPERCGLHADTLKDDGTTLKKEWLLNYYQELPREREGGRIIPLPITFVNLGDPEAWAWLKDRIFAVLRKGNIGMYREDFNLRPLLHWQNTDTPGRTGITENKYIVGHLALWDAIRAEFGGMILDSCASGGRRNDLETMRRAVPLHYTDFFITDLAARQAVHRSIFRYFPFFKAETSLPQTDNYDLMSSMAAWTNLAYDMPNLPADQAAQLREYIAAWEQVNPYYYADYYPLLDWNIDSGEWLAWQFIDPVTGCGFAQAFRRPLNGEPVKNIPLKGLDAAAQYKITRLLGEKAGESVTQSGSALLTAGFAAALPDVPGAGLWKIEKV